VGAGAQPDLLRGAGAIAGRDMLGIAWQHQLDWRTSDTRKTRRDHDLGAGAEFRAEAAAQVFGYHAHLVGRQIEEYGQVVAHGEDALGRAPDRKLIVLPARDRTVSLE